MSALTKGGVFLESQTMTIAAYARHSGLAVNTVRRIVRVDGFPALRVGNRYYIYAALADDWLKSKARENFVFKIY